MTEHLKNIQPNSKTRSELIIIRTNQSKKIKKVLEQEHISYEIYQGGEKKKMTDKELAQAYREAYADKEREQECQVWDVLETENWDD